MGNEVRGLPEDPTLGSVGRYLRGQRLLRGISLDDLAVLTKLPRRSLERLAKAGKIVPISEPE